MNPTKRLSEKKR